MLVGKGKGKAQKDQEPHFQKPRKQGKCPSGTQTVTPRKVNSTGNKCMGEFGKAHFLWFLCPKGGLRLFGGKSHPLSLIARRGSNTIVKGRAGQQHSLSDGPFWLEPGWLFSSLSSPNQYDLVQGKYQGLGIPYWPGRRHRFEPSSATSKHSQGIWARDSLPEVSAWHSLQRQDGTERRWVRRELTPAEIYQAWPTSCTSESSQQPHEADTILPLDMRKLRDKQPTQNHSAQDERTQQLNPDL